LRAPDHEALHEAAARYAASIGAPLSVKVR
jgi:hypothetical protein